MTYPGLKDDKARDDLIEYLRVATAIPATPAVDENELERGVFFYKHVRPIIHNYCDSCHGHATPIPPSNVNGMLLQTYEEVTRTSIGGVFVTPGDPDKSLLLTFLDGDSHMTTVKNSA
jgi:hypothetical protein